MEKNKSKIVPVGVGNAAETSRNSRKRQNEPENRPAKSGPSRLQQPPVYVNVNLNKVKMESDYRVVVKEEDKKKGEEDQDEQGTADSDCKGNEEIVNENFNCGCNFTTKDPKELARHLSMTHQLPKLTLFKMRSEKSGSKSKTNKRKGCKKIAHNCKYCQKQFLYSSKLKRRLNVHTGQKDFDCNLCDFSAAQKFHLQIHIRRHLKERPFKCGEPNCGASFTTSTSLNTHQLVEHKNDKKYPCTLCPYKTHAKFCLVQHMKNVHSEFRPFKCPHANCEFGGKQKCNLYGHLKVHSQIKDHVCDAPDCGFATKYAQVLRVHVKLHSAEEKEFKCHFCSYSSHRYSNLAVHIRNHTKETPFLQSCHLKKHQNVQTNNNKKYPCSLCPYKTHSNSCLSQHMKNIHSASMPFKCPHANCEYAAGQKSYLAQHLKIHSAEKPHICSVPDCGFKTRRAGALKDHMKIHSKEEKGFKCHFCSYSSHHRSNLIAHIRRHTGETPFACPVKLCPYKSKYKTALSRHMKNHAA